jgi:hypothetical protein
MIGFHIDGAWDSAVRELGIEFLLDAAKSSATVYQKPIISHESRAHARTNASFLFCRRYFAGSSPLLSV